MSIAVLKRKTMNGNPRLAPISGAHNGNFGFSLNGTRRNIGRVGEHLAPGGMTGPISTSTAESYIADKIYTTSRINGHASSCCTNDTAIVKPSVINTRGMLSRRLNCLTAGKEACTNCTSCEVGNPPYGCYNWVKKPLYSGEQGQYIERVIRANFKGKNGIDCHETKYGPNGLFIDLSCNKPICECIHKSQFITCIVCGSEGSAPGSQEWAPGIWPCKRKNLLTMAKPGIRTVDYGTYMHKGLMKKHCLPQTGHYLKPWVMNASKAECRNEPSTCICDHLALDNGCAPNNFRFGSSIWISYNAQGVPYLNMRFGALFYYAFNFQIKDDHGFFGSEYNTVFTPVLHFEGTQRNTLYLPINFRLNINNLSPSVWYSTSVWTTPLSQWMVSTKEAQGVSADSFIKKLFTHCNIQLGVGAKVEVGGGGSVGHPHLAR